ncbi:MAG: SCP2 sterol-binding domain-containing protein [Candidatus Promineifilaceae bacterium]
MADISAIFEGMKARFNPEKAAGLNASVQFDLSGEGGGKWAVQIADGTANVIKGGVDNPTATVKMTAEDYADMTSGKLNAMTAFMTGKVKVEGDLNTVMKFQSMFGM